MSQAVAAAGSRILASLFVGGVLLLAGPAGAAGPSTKERLEILEQKAGETVKALDDLRGENAKLRAEIARLAARLQEATDLGTRLADLGTQLDSQGTDLRALFENVNDLQGRLRRMEDQLQATLRSLAQPPPTVPPVDYEAQPGTAPQTSPSTTAPDSAVTPPAAPPASPGLPPGVAEPTGPAPGPRRLPTADPETLFQSAYADYARGNYELAIEGFTEYVTSYPNLRQSDDALYWIGESWSVVGDFPAAIRAYDRVIREHPDGDRVPDARLKKGLALFEDSRILEGTSELRAVVRQYPETPAARAACQRLREMRLECE